jgi:hypothetical protein
MDCGYAVTFEFDTRAPVTARGTVRARSARTVARRAVDQATAQYPGLAWRSLVVVLERAVPAAGEHTGEQLAAQCAPVVSSHAPSMEAA